MRTYQSRLTRDEMNSELRACVVFALTAIPVLYFVLSL